MDMSDPPKFGKADLLLIIGATFALGLLFLSIRSSLTPILTFTVVMMFLWPLRTFRYVQVVMGITGFVFLIWLVAETRDILLPFAISFALAYLFDPVVDWMEKFKIPRWTSVLLIVFVVLALLTLLLIFLVPRLVEEMSDLVNTSLTYSKKFTTWLESEGIALLTRYLNLDTEKLYDFALKELPNRVQQLFQALFKGTVSVTSGISTALGQLLNLVLIPFLFFYILKDFNKITCWIKSNLPRESGWKLSERLDQIHMIINGFFRGQLMVCFIVGVLTILGLSLFNIKYAVLLGIMAGVLNIIPYVGLAITLTFGIIVGLFSPSPLLSVIKIIAVIEAIQILEGSFLSPRIVGDKVGLHPAWVIFAILIFSHFWGLFGLIIAVPTAASLKIFISAALENYRQHFGAQG
ncbi:AI-2E family transporter [candidate division KSB1 bacterium]|jgi:predicted PurR-regulated permease PerM|nr:AI-2E family transporter [candidate division KSB1 bacterium]